MKTPIVTEFKTESCGNGLVVFITIIKELTTDKDNTPVIEAQLRAITQATTFLTNKYAESKEVHH